MTTYNEQLQRLWHEYNRAHGGEPSPVRDVISWALARGKLEAPPPDPVGDLAGEMARALREEYATDASGRRFRVNHAVKVTKDGVQTTFWAELGQAERGHMIAAFGQRRKQIVGDCIQLRIDVDAYNDMRKDRDPIQLILDFTDDVEEHLAIGPKAA